MTEPTDSGLLDRPAIETLLRWWHDHFENIASVDDGKELGPARERLVDCENRSALLLEGSDFDSWKECRKLRIGLRDSFLQMLDAYQTAAGEDVDRQPIDDARHKCERICDVSTALERLGAGGFRRLLVDLLTHVDESITRRRRIHREESPKLDVFARSIRETAEILLGDPRFVMKAEENLASLVDSAFELRGILETRLNTVQGRESATMKPRAAPIEHDCRRILRHVDLLLVELGASSTGEDSSESGEEDAEGEDEGAVPRNVFNESVEVPEGPLEIAEPPRNDRVLLAAACEAAHELCRVVQGLIPILPADARHDFIEAQQSLYGTAGKTLEFLSQGDPGLGPAYKDLLIRYQWVHAQVVRQVTWTKREARRGVQYRTAWVTHYEAFLTVFVERISKVFAATSDLHKLMRETADALETTQPGFGFRLDRANNAIANLQAWMAHVTKETQDIQEENRRALLVSDKATLPGKLYIEPYILVINGELISREAAECQAVHDISLRIRRGGSTIPLRERVKRVAKGLTHLELYHGDVSVVCPPEGANFAKLALGEITSKRIRV